MTDILGTNQQVVLSVRVKGDSTGPQTGDVVLAGGTMADWNPEDSYTKNEVIIKDGNIYRAIDGVDAGTEWDPELWESVTDVVTRLPNYEAQHLYKKNEIVFYETHLYRALSDFRTGTNWDPDEWEPIDSVNTILRDFEAEVDYSKDEIITHDGKLYRARRHFVSSQHFIPFDWEVISDVVLTDFIPNHDYITGNIVTVSGVLYRATRDFTSGPSFAPDDWEKLSGVGIMAFEPNHYYAKDSVVIVEDKLYVAKKDFTSLTEFSPLDWQIVSETTVSEYKTGTIYQKNQIISHNGALWAANETFTSNTEFNENQWFLLNPTLIADFIPGHKYLRGNIIYQDRFIWYAASDFTSGSSFDPSEWIQLGTLDQQEVYRISTEGWRYPVTVHPETTFEEKIYAGNSDVSYVQTFTERGATEETLKVGNVSDNSSALLKTTSMIATDAGEAGIYAVQSGAQATLGAKKIAGDPYSFLTLSDEKDEKFEMIIDGVNSSLTLTKNIQKAVTESILSASTTQRGIVKLDGRTIDTEDGAITARPLVTPFLENTAYKEDEIVRYLDKIYVSRRDFTTSEKFDIQDWRPIKSTLTKYAKGSSYFEGDMVYAGSDIFYSLRDIPEASEDITTDPNWRRFTASAITTVFDKTLKAPNIIMSTNVQGALEDLDTYIFETVDKRLDAIEEEQEIQNGDIASLKTTTTTLREDVNALRNEHDALKSGHDTLETDVSTLQTKLNTLQTNFNTLKTNFDNLKSDYDTLKSDHNTLRSEYEALDARVTALGG